MCIFFSKDFFGESITTQVVSQSSSLLIVEARNIESGKIDLNMSCVGPFRLQVTSKSQIDFTYQLRTVVETGDVIPVSGDLIKGIERFFSWPFYCKLLVCWKKGYVLMVSKRVMVLVIVMVMIIVTVTVTDKCSSSCSWWIYVGSFKVV